VFSKIDIEKKRYSDNTGKPQKLCFKCIALCKKRKDRQCIDVVVKSALKTEIVGCKYGMSYQFAIDQPAYGTVIMGNECLVTKTEDGIEIYHDAYDIDTDGNKEQVHHTGKYKGNKPYFPVVVLMFEKSKLMRKDVLSLYVF